MVQADAGFVREVGGTLASSVITRTPTMRIEVLRREANNCMSWHFRQPELCLFWFVNGAERLKATVDGRPVDRIFRGRNRLAIFPAAVEIEGEWNVGPVLDYVVVFLNPGFVGDRLRDGIECPTIAFEHDGLTRGLAELSREAATPDDLFDLLAEGWATQALAHISRVSRRETPRAKGLRGGITAKSLQRIDDYLRSDLARPISLADLSAIACLSQRHFIRAFQESMGSTPYQHVLALRIEDAKRRLSATDETITDIALATGFGHGQHFSTRFRRATGMTPSRYRQQHSA